MIPFVTGVTYEIQDPTIELPDFVS